MSRVLVTGAGGWLGSLLAGCWPVGSVRQVDRTPAPGVEQVELGPDTDWAAVLDDVSTVVHLAGCADAAAGWPLVREANVATTRLLLEACAHHDVRRVVLASSVWAARARWRPGLVVPGDATADPGDHAYGRSKAGAERLLAVWTDADPRRTGIALRLGGCVRGGGSPRAPQDAWEDGCWLGTSDWRAAATAAAHCDRPGLHLATVTSRCPRPGWDLGPARRLLGYEPAEELELIGVPTAPTDRRAGRWRSWRARGGGR